MKNIKQYFKSPKKQKEESQAKLNALMPNYQQELNALNAKYGVAFDNSIEVTSKGIIPKLKVILVSDIPVAAPPLAPSTPPVPPVPAK